MSWSKFRGRACHWVALGIPCPDHHQHVPMTGGIVDAVGRSNGPWLPFACRQYKHPCHGRAGVRCAVCNIGTARSTWMVWRHAPVCGRRCRERDHVPESRIASTEHVRIVIRRCVLACLAVQLCRAASKAEMLAQRQRTRNCPAQSQREHCMPSLRRSSGAVASRLVQYHLSSRVLDL